MWTQDLLKIRDSKCEAHQRRGWGAVAADCGVSRFSDGCELVWGQGTELPLCVSPDSVAEWLGYVAVVTKINYSRWKTFLRFPFFFFFSFFSLSPLLHTSFSFFFLALGVIQMCATLEGDDEKGRGCSLKIYQGVRSWPLTVHRSGSVFWRGKCPLWLDLHTDSKSPLP